MVLEEMKMSRAKKRLLQSIVILGMGLPMLLLTFLPGVFFAVGFGFTVLGFIYLLMLSLL